MVTPFIYTDDYQWLWIKQVNGDPAPSEERPAFHGDEDGLTAETPHEFSDGYTRYIYIYMFIYVCYT